MREKQPSKAGTSYAGEELRRSAGACRRAAREAAEETGLKRALFFFPSKPRPVPQFLLFAEFGAFGLLFKLLPLVPAG